MFPIISTYLTLCIGIHCNYSKFAGKKYGSKKGYKKKGKSSVFDEEHSAKGEDGFSLHKIDDFEDGGKKSKKYEDGHHQDYGYEHGGSSYGGHHKSGAKKKARKFSKASYLQFLT